MMPPVWAHHTSRELRLVPGRERVLAVHQPPAFRPCVRCWATKAKKRRTEWLCDECGYSSLQYFGTCPHCRVYGKCREIKFSPEPPTLSTPGGHAAAKRSSRSGSNGGAGGSTGGWLQSSQQVTSLGSLRSQSQAHSRIMQLRGDFGSEVARVLGGGVRAGSLVLVGGGPGLGKSTLLLQLAALMATSDPWQAPSGTPLSSASDRVLYISGEESEDQIADRAQRLRLDDGGNVDLLCDNDMDSILERIHEERPKAIILDSVQTMSLADASGAAGSVSQVKEVAKSLITVCKQTLGIPAFLVGHITKGGDMAGPKTLEHIVDTVLYIEAIEGSTCRVLRASKNRFGSTDEVGMFEMTTTEQQGLQPVTDPTGLLRDHHRLSEDGSTKAATATAVTMDAQRPMLVQIQALCTQTGKDVAARRTVTGGLNWNRFDQVVAVLSKHGRLKLWDQDCRVNVLGGMPAMEPAIDASIAAAIVSSFYSIPVPWSMAFIGELDLAGDFRHVKNVEKRVSSAVQLGFKQIIVPPGSKTDLPKTLQPLAVECRNVQGLIRIIKGYGAADSAPQEDPGD